MALSSFFPVQLRLLVALLSLAFAKANAQLPAGSIAPDFTVVDVQGQTWNLYSLLNQHQVVLLVFFSTSCPSCWAYHQGKAVEQFYQAHGPGGDNRVRVLMIESDPLSNANCILGSNGCNAQTLGNWTSGVSFPLINSTAVAQTYNAGSGGPVLMMLCPDRKVYPVGTIGPGGLWQQASTCPVLNGQRNAGIFHYNPGSVFREICDTIPLAPSFELINIGALPVSSAAFELRWNGAAIQNLYWSGELDTYSGVSLAFEAVSLEGSGLLETALVALNNLPSDEDTSDNTYARSFTKAAEMEELDIVLRLRTDQYGAETYWELRDEWNNVLESGGNTLVGPNGGGMFPDGAPDGPGAYGSNMVIRDTFTLPASGCYSFHIYDAFGDGICCNYGAGYYRLFPLNSPNPPLLAGGGFAASDHRLFGATDVTGTYGAASEFSWDLWPNPVRDKLTLTIQDAQSHTFSLFLCNALGQITDLGTFFHPGGGEESFPLALDHLPPGLYWITLEMPGRRSNKAIVINP